MREGTDSGDSMFFEDLAGIEQAFGIQGGYQGPELIRTGAGIYLHHDIGDYLSRYQTYGVTSAPTGVATPGAGAVSVLAPDVNGLRYGRYLVGVSLVATSVANLTSVSANIQNSNKQPGYPAFAAPSFLWAPGDALQTGAAQWILLPRASALKLPVWCAPGTYLNFNIFTAGVSGTYSPIALWYTSEKLDPTEQTPAGQLRSPVKI